MILTAENYFSVEAAKHFMSASQYKSFAKCEECALNEVNGTYIRPETDALLQGSYVDAHFECTLDVFSAKHPELFRKNGELLSQYKKLDYVIDRIENQPLMMSLLGGEKQKIMTGEIAGIPFKIKIDSYLEGQAIVDLKCMRDFKPVWVDDEFGKVPWFQGWGYDIQGAIYREIVLQNTGKLLPFVLVAATKEAEPDLDVVAINDGLLDFRLAQVAENAPRFDAIKKGIIEPERCEQCDYCRHSRIITDIRDSVELEVI